MKVSTDSATHGAVDSLFYYATAPGPGCSRPLATASYYVQNFTRGRVDWLHEMHTHKRPHACSSSSLARAAICTPCSRCTCPDLMAHSCRWHRKRLWDVAVKVNVEVLAGACDDERCVLGWAWRAAGLLQSYQQQRVCQRGALARARAHFFSFV